MQVQTSTCNPPASQLGLFYFVIPSSAAMEDITRKYNEDIAPYLELIRIRDGCPPPELQIRNCFALKLDKRHLADMGVILNMNFYDANRLSDHMVNTWDDGARRIVIMYFKGYPHTWVRFANEYFESLVMLPGRSFPAPKYNYSSYAVWFARGLAHSVGLHSRGHLLCRELCSR